MITRAEVVTVVSKAFDFTTYSEDNFPDINSGAWYAEQFRTARKNEYITGDEKGNANPEKNIIRAEMIVLLADMLKLSPVKTAADFIDKDTIPDWALGGVISMWENDYIVGYPDDTVRPLNQMTRAEVFSIIAKLRKIVLPEPETENVPAGDVPLGSVPAASAITAPLPTPSPSPTSSGEVSGGSGGSGGGSNPTVIIPQLVITVNGNLKENRKLTVFGASSAGLASDYEKLTADGVVSLLIKPVNQGISESVICIDNDTALADYNDLIIKQAGNYEITLKVERLQNPVSVTKTITIAPDLPPEADFALDEAY